MFNSETWHGVNLDDVEAFERVDEALLRGLVDGHAKVGLPTLYLELGQEPIRFILAARRIMYLHTLLTREDKEMTKKIYRAQQDDPVKGDLYLLVKKDREMLNVDQTEDEISDMKKVKEAALKHLTNEIVRKEMTKIKNNKYEKLEAKEYTKHPTISQKQASLLFALRTQRVRGIRANFGGMYPNKECPMEGCTHLDTLPMLLTCPALRTRASDMPTTVCYEDMFSPRVEEQKAAVKMFSRLLEIREEILSPPAL